jgi:hypothetical protein
VRFGDGGEPGKLKAAARARSAGSSRLVGIRMGRRTGLAADWRWVQKRPTSARLVSDQVIRENPASRGTETSAEVLVGPPWRMESNAGQQQWY